MRWQRFGNAWKPRNADESDAIVDYLHAFNIEATSLYAATARSNGRSASSSINIATSLSVSSADQAISPYRRPLRRIGSPNEPEVKNT
jgi:plasmid stabilization system protein ParE